MSLLKNILFDVTFFQILHSLGLDKFANICMKMFYYLFSYFLICVLDTDIFFNMSFNNL